MLDLALPSSLPYLLECSENTLQDLELKWLDLEAQCRKRAEAELDQAVAYREGAGVCRFLITHRSDLIDLAKTIVDGKQRLLHFPEFKRTA